MLVQLITAVRCLRRWSVSALATWGAAWSPQGLQGTDDGDPRVCPSCLRPFACPVEWDEDGDTHWWIALRCGECGHRREVTLANTDTARLEESLAEDALLIQRAAERFDAERMALEVDAFIFALGHDLIAPDDFATEIH